MTLWSIYQLGLYGPLRLPLGSAGLVFLMAGAIGRFLGRTLWPRANGAPHLGPEQARDEAAIAVPLG